MPIASADLVSEHVGSTVVVGLSAKPIVDINVGVKSADLVVARMATRSDYIYYKVFNDIRNAGFSCNLSRRMRQWIASVSRELADIPHDALYDRRVAHVHVWVFCSPDWERA